MKTTRKIIAAGLVLLGSSAIAQQVQVKVQPSDVSEMVAKQVPLQKTLTGWDILGNLYQLSVNDITADDKSIKFKSTIFGLNHLDGKPVTSKVYRDEHNARHIELFATFGYKERFDPSNLTTGATFSIVNRNDATESDLLQKLPTDVKDTQDKLSKAVDQLDAQLRPDLSSATPDQRAAKVAQLNGYYNALNAFVKSGDPNDAPKEIKKLLDDLGIIGYVTKLHDQMSDLSRQIANRLNITFAPQVTYAFNQSNVQGASFLFNGVKGFTWLSKRTSQFTAKAGYVMGDDTIIKRSAIGRHQITTQAGFNQVFFTKTLKADDGTSSPSPAMELAVAYGYNYLTRGYTDTEQRGQQTFSAKLGVLIGKDSWLLVPFTYNFATKEKLASVTIKVNLGSAPFK